MDVMKNIIQIITDKGFKQRVISDALERDPAVVSNMKKKGGRDLKIQELEKIATALGVSVIDLFTYPKKYVDVDSIQNSERVSVTFEVSPDRRNELLKLVNKDK